jgi:excisionase family DNA binding protein
MSIPAQPVTDAERNRLLDLGADLERAWNHAGATTETRKRIVRSVLKEIVVRVAEAKLDLRLHWYGGDHTELCVAKNRVGAHRWKTDEDLEASIHGLACLMSDGSIASLLNRSGKRTGKGHTWTEPRVRSFRDDHGIPVYREGERAERDELTLDEAASALEVSKMSVLRMIRAGLLPAQQSCKGAPWVIRGADLQSARVRHATKVGMKNPVTEDASQRSLEFQ